MPALVAGIQSRLTLFPSWRIAARPTRADSAMDGRDKHGHDGEWLDANPSCPHLLRASNSGYS